MCSLDAQLVMTPNYRLWEQFMEHLCGPEGINVRQENGRWIWNCSAQTDRPHARCILEQMGMDVDLSLDFFDAHGGHCDCEILLNIDPNWEVFLSNSE